MSHNPFQDDNPYASPTYTAAAGVAPDGRMVPTKAPVDVLDLLIGVVNVLLVLAVVIALPAVAALATLWLLGPGPRAAVVCVVLGLPTLCWCVWMGLRVVKSVSIDEEGLHFQCVSGRSDDWPWQTIVSIRAASRKEVVWDGWIRPLLNPRERTSCMSALGHYRIEGETDYCFFPPKNPEAFVEAVARYRPDLLKPSG